MLDKNDFASPKAVGCVGFKLQPSRTLRFVLLKCACDKHSLAIAFFSFQGVLGHREIKRISFLEGRVGGGGEVSKRTQWSLFHTR